MLVRGVLFVNPDEYIKLEPGKWFPAVSSWPNEVAYAYFLAIIHYRCHRHCRGLENDSESLRRICRIESRENWESHIMNMIFDNGDYFTMDEHGLWHQNRAKEDYEADKQSYQRAVHRGQLGVKARWGKKRKAA